MSIKQKRMDLRNTVPKEKRNRMQQESKSSHKSKYINPSNTMHFARTHLNEKIKLKHERMFLFFVSMFVRTMQVSYKLKVKKQNNGGMNRWISKVLLGSEIL